MLFDGRYLLMDDVLGEGTSAKVYRAVDTETDAKIRKAISQRFGKSTVILISHRITTLSAADKIIVLDGGKIAEEGTHDQLKSAGGIYQKIYETQSGLQEVNL